MSLLSIAHQVALNVGIPQPDQIVGAPSREAAELLQMANETGEELARRVQWGALTETTTTTGGTLPADFDRLTDGITVFSSGNIVRPLTLSEWVNLPGTTGTPRYFLLQGNIISLWPAGQATVVYQSKHWTDGARFTADDQTARIDEELFTKAMIVRWRRQKGMPYADEEAELEAALEQFARFDDRSRV